MDEAIKEKKKPKVVIFGEDVTDDEKYSEDRHFHRHFRHHHHHHAGGMIWGVFIIFAGVIFLLNNLGLVPWSVWNGIGHFWPVILILIGIDILLGRSGVSRLLTFLLTLAIFATIFGIILLRTSPQALSFLPSNILVFLNTVSNYLQIK